MVAGTTGQFLLGRSGLVVLFRGPGRGVEAGFADEAIDAGVEVDDYARADAELVAHRLGDGDLSLRGYDCGVGKLIRHDVAGLWASRDQLSRRQIRAYRAVRGWLWGEVERRGCPSAETETRLGNRVAHCRLCEASAFGIEWRSRLALVDDFHSKVHVLDLLVGIDAIENDSSVG